VGRAGALREDPSQAKHAVRHILARVHLLRAPDVEIAVG
jgi:hypothetical protein